MVDYELHIKTCLLIFCCQSRNCYKKTKLLKHVQKEGLSHSLNFEWFSRFRNRHECVVDSTHTGRSHSKNSTETIEKVLELMISNRQSTIRAYAKKRNISKKENRKIF